MDYSEFFASTGLPMPSSMPSVAQVKREARERSSDLLSQWETLRKIIERHEETLRKRWTKKSKTQRTAILLRAWPKMAPKHRPDFEAMKKESNEQIRVRGTKFRDHYLFPYINIEDLARGKSLPLFLNSRARNHPNNFAHSDFEAIHLGQISGATMPAFLNEHTMFLDGETVDAYGKLVAWDDDDEAFDMMHTRLAHCPGEGLLVLEIQQKVLRFLNSCCKIILHNMDASVLTSDQTPTKPEPAFAADTDWPTLISLAAEAPYRAPAKIDFVRLKSVIDARSSDAEDHVRALREDPGYFADFILDWSDHRQEKLLDTNGVRHPVLDKPLFWDRVIGNVVVDAYGSLLAWDIASKQLAVLASLQEKYSATISPRKHLPKEYTKALLTFQYHLDQMQKSPISHLQHGLAASPYYRSRFDREPQVSGSTIIGLRSKGGPDSLFWHFSRLWNGHQLFLLGFTTVVDELEKVIQSDPKEKQKISSLIARTFAELGVIAKARHELEIYMPWAAGFENDMLDHKDSIQKEFSESFTLLADLDRHSKTAPFAKTGDPTGARFYHPSDKRRTKENTESMRNAEQNLDLFWKTLDDHMRHNTGRTLQAAFEHLLKDTSPLERTPEWTEPAKVQVESEIWEEKDGFMVPFSELNINPENSGAKFVPQILKSKAKTRGKAFTESTDTAGEVPEQEVNTQPAISLTPRAFKVFKTLFHAPSTTDLPGEVAWADFLFAMAATGFAPQKLYGSIWNFSPTNLDVKRSIQFHEPHPRAKIPFRNARRMGRRLTKAYGWHLGMFVQASKD